MGGGFLTPLHNYRSRVGRKHSRGVTMTIGMAYETLTVTRFDAIEHVGNSFASGLINQLEALAVFRNSDNRGERWGTDLGADKTSPEPVIIMPPWAVALPKKAIGLPLIKILLMPSVTVSPHAVVSPTRKTGIPLMFTSPEPLLLGLVPWPVIGHALRSLSRAAGFAIFNFLVVSVGAKCTGSLYWLKASIQA